MDRFVLSDAAPLIRLAQVDGLSWLKVIFGRVHLTEQMPDEIIVGLNKPGEDALAAAIKRRTLRVHTEWRWTEPEFFPISDGAKRSVSRQR
ncbi:MAG TPA: hypothetical protein VNE82_11765 [Candidatus Binataceae bacterium]|nr:hypothetical protein [Candidatus Binataceae bacterium]